MAKATRMGLFVDRFIAFNLTRYSANAQMKALFTGLTESELIFDDLTGSGAGLRSLTVKCIPRNFIGYNQTYHAANLHDVNGYDMIDPVLAVSLAKVKERITPGIHAYLDADGVTVKIIVLLAHDTLLANQQTLAKATFNTSVRVVLLANDMVSNASALTVSSPTVYGVIPFALAAEPIKTVPDTDYGQLTNPEDAVY